ncbi:hypothetical protein ACYPKM_01265 [Pseudomonas aeruginosa]
MSELATLDADLILAQREFHQKVISPRRAVKGRQAVSTDEVAAILNLPQTVVPFTFAAATVGGDLDLARAIWDKRGEFQLSIIPNGVLPTVIAGGYRGQWDEVMSTTAFYKKAACGRDLAELFALFTKALGEPHELAGNPFDALLLQSRIYTAFDTCAEGNPDLLSSDLPSLADGEVTNPELALALRHKAESEPFGEIYDHMLCWATPAMVDQFPDQLTPYALTMIGDFERLPAPAELAVDEADGIRSEHRQPMEAIGKFSEKFDFMNHTYIQPGRNAIDPSKRYRLESVHIGLGLPSKADPLNSLVAHALAPQSAREGFGGTRNRVLCRTTASFLLSLPSKGLDLGRLEGEEGLVRKLESYFPIGILQHLKAKESAFQLSWELDRKFTVESKPVAGLVNKLVSQDAMDECIRVIGKDFTKFLVLDGFKMSYSQNTLIEAMTLPAIQRTFGFGSSTFPRFFVKESEIDKLSAQGYRFDPGTEIYYSEGGIASDTVEQYLEPFKRLLRMAQGKLTINAVSTVIHDGPEAVVAGLTTLRTRVLKLDDLEAQLMVAQAQLLGFDALLQVSKTAGSWNALERVFGSDAVKPHFKDAPKQYKTKKMSRTLSL